MNKVSKPKKIENTTERRKRLSQWYSKTFEKLQKTKRHKEFLLSCEVNGITPKFCNPPKNSKTFFSKRQISNSKTKKLQQELRIKNEQISSLSTTLSHIYFLLKPLFSNIELSNHLSKINSKIKYKLKIPDQKRQKKLKNLIKKEKAVQKVEIINLTKTKLPFDISEILSKGLDHAYGGRPNKMGISTQMELLFKKLLKFCDKKKLDNFRKHELRALLFLKFKDLTECHTPDESIKKIQTFLEENPDIIISPVDKTKNVCIMTKLQYFEKLEACFISENFEKLKNDPTKNDLRKFRILLNKFLSHIDEKYHKKFEPIQRIKQGYGLIKLHKNGFPIRPIISSYNTITSNSESMLLQFLKPLEKNVKYSVDSSKTYKSQIQPILEKNDLREYTFVSFDAKDL